MMGIFDEASCSSLGRVLVGLGSLNQSALLAAIQKQAPSGLFPYQQAGLAAAEQQRMHQIMGMQAMMPYYSESPKRKKVESKTIETVEIRPEQDVKLLKAGKGI